MPTTNNPRSVYLHSTPSTTAQSETEDEVAPFFIDLTSLNEPELDRLRNVGLLPPLPDDGRITLLDDEKSDSAVPQSHEKSSSSVSTEQFDPYAVRLLRSSHIAYLVKALSEPLSRGFVSLDASHPWMVYWCLHSLDLLGYFEDDGTSIGNGGDGLANNVLMDIELMQKGQLLNRVVSTLEACWTEADVQIVRDEVLGDVRLNQLWRQQNESGQSTSSNNNEHDLYITITAGGFGGGPSQMPHVAPTYAAVLSLSIVASLGLHNKSPSHPYHSAGQAALHLLSRTRLQMYVFFVSLRVNASELYGLPNSTAFRMQHDGEVDVRASYCLLAPCYLLGLLEDINEDANVGTDKGNNPNTPNHNLLATSSIVQHIAACQTYEGGFGAEPHNEAHGGYTFCALAALRILNSVHLIDIQALSSWLAKRQMGYEGGFCGRTNKLVDGCYSFWLGGAAKVLDGWLLEQYGAANCDDGVDAGAESSNQTSNDLTFDEVLLQRYILLCAQDVNGGLRDKPSKQRDFYHSCYNLSGLSVAQHKLSETWPCRGKDLEKNNDEDLNNLFGDKSFNIIGNTDPVINIRVERVAFMLARKLNNS